MFRTVFKKLISFQLLLRALMTIVSFIPAFLIAQRTAIIDTLKPGKVIIILKAERYNFQDRDTLGKFISLAGAARVQQEKTFFDADSMVVNQKENWLEAFGHVHINDADSVHTYADYMKYLGKERKAFLNKNVKLTDGKGVLTSQDLEYDVGIKVGTYKTGGKLINGKTVLTSKEGYYYGDTKDIYFKNNVVLIDPEYKIYTDTLLYNISTDIASFVAPTKIINGKRIIKTKDGYYDLKHKKAQFGKRSVIDDSAYSVISDEMAFNDSTGQGELRGNVVYKTKDSISGYDLIANNLKINNKTEAMLATEKPILFIKQDADTIYITADTLYSAKLNDSSKSKRIAIPKDSIPTKETKLKKDTSSNRYFEAYYHVKIFSDSLQAIGDSMYYSFKDSAFRLFKNPVLWNQQNQVTGDTILLFTKNKQPEKLKVINNAMAISKVNSIYFNQTRGNTINGKFKDGKIDSLITRGSPAENIYYAEDDVKKLIGVNTSTSDVIQVTFADSKAEKVVFINDLKGTMFPMKQVNHEEIKVKKFKWLDALRPKTKFDILEN